MTSSIFANQVLKLMQMNSLQFFPKIEIKTGSNRFAAFLIRTNDFVRHMNFEANLEEK